MDDQEKQWFESQEEITRQKLAEKKTKALRKVDRANEILKTCKSHGGPFTSVKELDMGLKSITEEKDKKKTLWNEILLRKELNPKDCKEFPHLYLVKSMSVAQMKINLGILLSGSHETPAEEEMSFPDADSMYDQLHQSGDSTSAVLVNTDQEDDVELNEPCIAIWDTQKGREWFVGMTREKIGIDEYIVEYLEPLPNDNRKKTWQYPSRIEEQKTLKIQFLSCNVIGAWNLTRRKPVFVLENNDVIDELFNALY